MKPHRLLVSNPRSRRALWALLLLGWSLNANAQFYSDPFFYGTNGDGVILTRYVGTARSLVIPSTIDGLPVRIIGVSAFYYLFSPYVDRLTNVVVPDSVFNIETNAFGSCTNILSLCIGNNVTNLSDKAFYNCSRLRSVTVPPNTVSLGAYAFANCINLTNVTLPSALMNIGAGAFDNAQNLAVITVNEGNSVFSSFDGVLFDRLGSRLLFCPNGKTGAFTVPNGTTAIKEAAFANCARLTSVVVPDTVTNMGNSTFHNCTALVSASLGAGVLHIGASAFYSCSNLVQVNFSPFLVAIGDSAFQYCVSLTNFAMPNTLTNTGIRTFSDCTNLIRASISTNVTTIGDFLFWNCHKLHDVKIPPRAVVIGNGAFGNGLAITSLNIPDSVQSIGDYAFNASLITSLRMGPSVTNIGQRAFLGCSKISSTVIMPKGLLYIGDYGFSVCFRVPAIFFQGDAPALGNSALWDDLAATAYYLPGTLGWSNQLGDIPARLWNPLMEPKLVSFGTENQTCAININGTTNIPIVVEVSTNLPGSAWSSLFSGVLSNGAISVVDPKSTNYPRRFYRIRSP